MMQLLLSMFGILAKTVLGLFALVFGIWFVGFGIIVVSQGTPTIQFFAIGALTAAVLYVAHQLGGLLWRLLD